MGEVDYDIVNHFKAVCDKDDVSFCNVNPYLIVRNGRNIVNIICIPCLASEPRADKSGLILQIKITGNELT